MSFPTSAGDTKRVDFMQSLMLKHGTTHMVRRSSVYHDVIKLYDEELTGILEEYPFRTKFVGECAVDIGGVTRDMFSAFFEEVYSKHFDGTSLLVPVDTPHSGLPPFSILGVIFSHAYVVTGMLPIKIAFPTLASFFLAKPVNIPDQLLLEAFIDSLSAHDAAICKEALKFAKQGKEFSQVIQSGLITVLSRYGVCEMPRKDSLLSLFIGISMHHFVRKPAYFIAEIQSAIPQKHKPFWNAIDVSEFHAIYKAQQASPSKVLAMIEDPIASNAIEERIYNYLQQFVGSLRDDEVRAFLRFSTGSSVCSSTPITISFNSLSGLARRPISHTCTGSLELPSTYHSYAEFKNEFLAILNEDSMAWEMDAL